MLVTRPGKCGKGIVLTRDEAKELPLALKSQFHGLRRWSRLLYNPVILLRREEVPM